VNVSKPKKDSFSITQKGVKKTIKRKDGSVKKTVSKTFGNLGVTPSTGIAFTRGILPVTTKEKKKYKKDGALKKSKRIDKEGDIHFYSAKTTTKVNRKGNTSKKVVEPKNSKSTGTIRSQYAADRLSDKLERKEQRPAVKAESKAARAVNKSKRQSERTKSKVTASLQKAVRKADRLQRKADRPVKKAVRKADRLANKNKRVAARKTTPKKRRVVTRTKSK
jgi:hypothetical protein